MQDKISSKISLAYDVKKTKGCGDAFCAVNDFWVVFRFVSLFLHLQDSPS